MNPDLMALLQATGGVPQLSPGIGAAASGPEAPSGFTGWLMQRGLDNKQAEAFPGLMASMGQNLSAQSEPQQMPPPPPVGALGNQAAVQAAMQMMMQNMRRR